MVLDDDLRSKHSFISNNAQNYPGLTRLSHYTGVGALTPKGSTTPTGLRSRKSNLSAFLQEDFQDTPDENADSNEVDQTFGGETELHANKTMPVGKPQVVEYDDDQAERDEENMLDMLSDLKKSITDDEIREKPEGPQTYRLVDTPQIDEHQNVPRKSTMEPF